MMTLFLSEEKILEGALDHLETIDVLPEYIKELIAHKELAKELACELEKVEAERDSLLEALGGKRNGVNRRCSVARDVGDTEVKRVAVLFTYA